MTFKDFLGGQTERKDNVGDLARKVLKRKLKKYSYEEIYQYLYSTHAPDSEIHALKAAFFEYSGEEV